MNSRDVLGEANALRERGSFLQALIVGDEALLGFAEDKDLLGMAETYAARFISLKHLYLDSQEKAWALLAHHAAQAGVALAKESHQPEALAVPLMNLGKSYELLGEYNQASDVYAQAVESQQLHPAEFHNRPAVLLDMQIHQAGAEALSGDSTAVDRIVDLLEQLAKTDEPDYNKEAWLSGGYMKVAFLLWKTDQVKAEEFLNKARNIIEANSNLKLRKKQLAQLEAKMNT